MVNINLWFITLDIPVIDILNPVMYSYFSDKISALSCNGSFDRCLAFAVNLNK